MNIIKVISTIVSIITLIPWSEIKYLYIDKDNKSINVTIEYSSRKDIVISFYGNNIVDIYDTEHHIFIKRYINLQDIPVSEKINNKNFIRYIRSSVHM